MIRLLPIAFIAGFLLYLMWFDGSPTFISPQLMEKIDLYCVAVREARGVSWVTAKDFPYGVRYEVECDEPEPWVETVTLDDLLELRAPRSPREGDGCEVRPDGSTRCFFNQIDPGETIELPLFIPPERNHDDI